MIRKIISGGQTGADRAGLDFAIETGLEHGGYVPSGRKAEDGRIDELYNLVELSTSSYPARTRRHRGKASPCCGLVVMVSCPAKPIDRLI